MRAPNPARFAWTSAASSHTGRVRAINEDACLGEPQSGAWAVADGMGDMRWVSSPAAWPSGASWICPQPRPAAVHRHAQARLSANRRLRAEAARRDVPIIGTTIVALLASGRDCACVWAGDSRIYLFRAGRLKRLTCDHSQLQAALSGAPGART